MNDKILVIDDQLATDADLQDGFLSAIQPAKNPATGIMSRMPRLPRDNFEFHSGQDSDGRNSEEAVVNEVAKRWPKDVSEVGDRWSLILLDLQFDEIAAKKKASVRSDPQFGLKLLERLRREFGSDLPVVMLTTHAERKNDANYAGPDGFLAKPMVDEHISFQENFARCFLENALIPDLRTGDKQLIGRSTNWMKVLREARRFALNPIGIYLILGESGSGKTELVRYMHHYSGRSGHFEHYVARPTNQDLVPNELFGNWYGAHNNADRSQSGKIERCHQGTFFLDEIPNLPTDIQKAILELRGTDENGWRSIPRLGFFPTSPPARVNEATSSIQDGARLDGNKVRADVMIVVATNRDLRDESVRKEMNFQFDLYNRLGGPLVLPPLNDRKQDAPAIFAIKVQEGARQLGRQRQITINSAVDAILQRIDYSLPGRGNIAFLEKLASNALMQLREFDEIIPRHLPPEVVKESEVLSRDAACLDSTTTSVFQDNLASPTTPKLDANPAIVATDPAKLMTQFALAKSTVDHLRYNADLLERALIETRENDRSTGLPGDFVPAAALAQLLGLEKVEGADIKRHLNEILGSILNRAEYLAAPLRNHGFNELVDYVKSRPILMEFYHYATDRGYTIKRVNEALKGFHDNK